MEISEPIHISEKSYSNGTESTKLILSLEKTMVAMVINEL